MGRQSFSVYLFLHHGNRSFTDATDDDFRTPSLERRQECCVRKQVNGNMTRSEESIILMTSYRPPSFWAGVRISCEKDGKQQYDTERRIYLLLWHLTGLSVMIMDSLLAFRMTFWHEWHFTGRQKAVGIPAGIYRPLASKMKESLKIMKIKLP